MPVRAGPLYLDINHATGSYVSANRQHPHRFSTLMFELTWKDIAVAPSRYVMFSRVPSTEIRLTLPNCTSYPSLLIGMLGGGCG